MPTLLVRDHDHHLHILPYDDDSSSLLQPLHIALPHHRTQQTKRPSPPTSTATHSLFSLPLDTLLIISSFLPPPALSTLITLSPSSHLTFRHPLLWRQLASSLSYLPSPHPPLPRWRPFTLSHHSALTRAQSTLTNIRHRLGDYRTWQLRGGLGQRGVVECEVRLGVRLPEEMRGWMVACDGEESTVPVGFGSVEGCRLLSGEEMVREGRVEGMGEDWVAVTEWAGINRVFLNVRDGGVWMMTGRSGCMTHVAQDWLSFLAHLFPPPYQH